jgi:Cd2+/Zn2+-exporting ATPase
VVKKIGYKIEKSTEVSFEKTKWWQDLKVVLTLIATGVLAVAFIGSAIYETSPVINGLLILSTLLAGYYPAKAGVNALVNKMPLDMNVLLIIAIIGAIYLGEYSEGAMVAVLFGIGKSLESYSMDKTRRSIRNLMDLTPTKATIKKHGKEVTLNVDEIKINDILVIKPGNRIALDGIVLSGESSVNQAPITGESMPVDKMVEDTVYAGTINEEGYLEVRVTKESGSTTLDRIIELVEEAQGQKAPSERFVDTFARYYTPIVILLAVSIVFIPTVFLGGNFHEWFYRAIALLVVSCPCALVISTPVSIVSALGNAARNGILIKGGAHIEGVGKAEAIAFDKTGTLTIGKPKVINVTDYQALMYAASIESFSEHPLAKAILAYANEKNVKYLKAEKFESLTGQGVKGYIDGSEVLVIKPAFAKELGVNLENIKESYKKANENGQTIVVVIKDMVSLGAITISDTLREESKETIVSLKENKIDNIVMLTGDNEYSANTVSKNLGIDKFYANLLPDEKLVVVKELQDTYKKVIMVGDGINDAPALALADIGITLGGAGTDTALDTADIVLMSDDLNKLPYTIKLSNRTISIIKQNIAFSLVVKLAAIFMVFPGWLTLWIAVLADTGAALVVILNGMRLLKDNK